MNRIIDIHINFEKQSSSSYTFKQMDTTELHCFFNGDVNLKNKKVNVFWKTPEKAIIQQEANSIDPIKNIAVIQLLDDCVSHAGKVEFEIELLDENDKIISTFKSSGVVAASIKGDVSASNSETYYQTIENELSKLEQKTNEIYSNENQRILNESGRVTAENEREELANEMTTAKNNAESLIETIENNLESGAFNGPANTLSIGSVISGQEAAATIVGDSPNQILNLVLPKGEKGDTGSQGIQGLQGEKGDKGDKGDKRRTRTSRNTRYSRRTWTSRRKTEKKATKEKMV